MKQNVESSCHLPQVQLAAGGIVWRKAGSVWKFAVIHRPRYDDWTLPKGKPEANETLAQTARREIHEELGCDVRFMDFAGVTHHSLPDGKVKVVLFWHVRPVGEWTFRANEEVDELLWLTPEEAARKLKYPAERELSARCPSLLLSDSTPLAT
jgi:8-oxo-dGTP diphosphatase